MNGGAHRTLVGTANEYMRTPTQRHNQTSRGDRATARTPDAPPASPCSLTVSRGCGGVEDFPSEKREVCAQGELDEMEREQLAREAEELAGEPYWPLLETLAWVGFLDLVKVAMWAPRCPAFPSLWGPASRYCWLSLTMAGEGAAVPKPMAVLLRALRLGDVLAIGRRRGVGDIEPIAKEQWGYLAFMDGPAGTPEGDYAINSDWTPGYALRAWWSDVRFDRLSVVTTFPAILAFDPTKDSDELVDATIRRLMSDTPDGHLAQNAGARMVKAIHRSRGLRELRDRIKALNPDNKPGPRGPRKIVPQMVPKK